MDLVSVINKTDKLVFDLNMYQVDYNEQKIKSLKKEIADKYGVPLKNVEINFSPITIKEDGTNVSLTSDIVNNIQDPKFQQKLFAEYIELKNITGVDIKDIIEIDNTINSHINFDSYAKYKSYKIKYAKWDNYLSYGKGNFFDFTKLHGLVLLCGEPENQCGKTTFAIDLIRFALFGKSPKCPTLESSFNIYLEKETEVMVEVGVEIDGIDYVIRRTVSRPSLEKRTIKSKCKQKVEYFRLINGDYELIENCEGESGTQTNNIIRESIGSVEDFNLVISATKKTLDNLLEMGQADKGKLFSRWLGLLTVEEKEKIAKEEYKKISKDLLSNKYNKATLESDIRDFNTVIAANKNEIIKLDEKLNISNNNINELNKEKTHLLSNRKEIKDNLKKRDVTTIENNILSLKNELMVQKNEYDIANDEHFLIKDYSFSQSEYDEVQEDILRCERLRGKLLGQYTELQKNIEKTKQLMKQKICPTCHHEIDIEEQSNIISEIECNIKNISDEGKANSSKIVKLKNLLNKLKDDKSKTERKFKLENKLDSISAKIKSHDLEIKLLLKDKEEIETNKENIRYNNEIDNKIRICEDKIKAETGIKEQLIRDIQSYKTENKAYEEEIKNHQVVINKLIEEEQLIKNWNVYQELVGKNGIIKIVLKNALPIINNEVKRILDGLCDFNVVLSINDNNTISIDLLRDDKLIDLSTGASGFEGTISSLALRAALSAIALLPSPNFLTLDEILSGISTENMENIMTLYHRILNRYDFILHICHDPNIVDYHDQIITVSKKDNVSIINFK